PLVETALAERFSVSRTPVREALRLLEHDGLVERGRRGLQVRQHSREQIYELYEVRSLLEAAAARAAAERHTPVDAMRLEELLERMEGEQDPSGEQRVQLNRAFHSAMWTAAHNGVLLEVIERLYLTLVRYPNTTLVAPGRWESALAEHRDLVNAILRRDADAAERISREHLETARDIRIRLVSSE
ncbi:MAG: GntR family transcriptional regulator, partial [Nocardioidaceae bacterium]